MPVPPRSKDEPSVLFRGVTSGLLGVDFSDGLCSAEDEVVR